jgi:glycosyltransferase involved in cell wall biosynthesis
VPKVSVIIPAYNRAHFLGEAIQSVLDQTFPDFELIVVDDGSTDNTKEVVESFKDPRIRYIYQENRGQSAAQNTGIKASGSEYIAILGSDDMWLPQNLELKVKVLDARPDVALVCSDTYFFDDRTGAILGRFWHDKRFTYPVNPGKATQQPLREMLSHGCFIAPQMAVVRRQVFTEVGYFDESLRRGDDWDMFVRIVRRFPAIETIDMPLGRNRQHDGRLTANQEGEYEWGVVIFNKALNNYSLSGSECKLIKRRLAGWHFQYGHEMMMEGGITEGRQRLLASIKVNPWSIRPYIYLALSFLGTKPILTLRSWKKWVERCFGRGQPSDDASSNTG